MILRCIVAVFLFLPMLALAAKGTWPEVQSIAPGTKVQVLKKGKAAERVKGTVSRVTATEIVVATKKGEVSIPQAEVRKVSIPKAGKRLTRTLIGAGIGAGAGYASSWAFCAGCRNEYDDYELVTGLLTLIGLGAGAGLGAAVGPYVTVYDQK